MVRRLFQPGRRQTMDCRNDWINGDSPQVSLRGVSPLKKGTFVKIVLHNGVKFWYNAPHRNKEIGGYKMCITVDLPPAMEQEAREYATVHGTTLERMVFDCLKAELERSRIQGEKASQLMARWRKVVHNGRGQRTEPYVFNRADAYPEGEFA